MTTYDNALKAIIGVPTLKVGISKPFPLVGEEVILNSKSKWIFNHNYKVNDGVNETETNITPVLGNSSKNVTLLAAGEFKQQVLVENVNKSIKVYKYIRPIEGQISPYFNIEVSKEIIRNDGETTQIILYPEFGYDFSRNKSITVDIFKENEEVPFLSLSEIDFTLVNGKLISNAFDISDRGVYDIEVTVNDLGTTTTTIRKINKLITVTPKLANRESAIELELIDGINYLTANNCPAGATVVLKLSPNHVFGQPVRLNINAQSASWENPTIITIDQATPLVLEWKSYYGIWVGGNSEYVVFDGRGYQNIEKGIKLLGFSDALIGVQGDCNELEIFELEIDTTGFAGVSIKHDPDVNNPQYWYDNFKYNRFLFHHNQIHDTAAEGMYIGYYGTGYITGTNSAGTAVKYRAHHMYNCRIYRNELYNIGYDGIQFNNGKGAEVCYNYLHNIAFNNVQDQTSGFSITLSGKLYNNILTDYSGPCIQFGLMGELEIFNNIFNNPTVTGSGLYGFSNNEPPNEDDSVKAFVDIPLIIHNNYIISRAQGYTAKDVNYWTNVKFIDNYVVYLTGPLSGNAVDYIVSKGNKIYKLNHDDDLEFDGQDESSKFGDSANNDLLMYPTSNNCFSGAGDYFSYDIRGYKNWYSKIFPSGGYLGLFKDNSIIDEVIQLYSVSVNAGDYTTASQIVNVSFSARGVISKFKISESSDLSSIDYIDYTGEIINFNLSDGFGEKTIYMLVSDGNVDSEVKSSSINYIQSPLTLNSIALSGGYNYKVKIAFNYSGSSIPVKYRIGTSSDLSATEWQDYTEGDTITYISSAIGDITLYGQLKDADENVSEILSSTIEVKADNRIGYILVGWTQALIGGVTSFDESTGYNKYSCKAGNTGQWKWVDGQMGGSLSSTTEGIDSIGGLTGDIYTTGDNSGLYPDSVMEKSLYYQVSYPGDIYKYRDIIFSGLPIGEYKFELFGTSTNSTSAANILKWLKWRLAYNGVATPLTMPSGFRFYQNKNQVLSIIVNKTDESDLTFQLGFANNMSATMRWYLSAIKITEL